jgi:hypothetical protein
MSQFMAENTPNFTIKAKAVISVSSQSQQDGFSGILIETE